MTQVAEEGLESGDVTTLICNDLQEPSNKRAAHSDASVDERLRQLIENWNLLNEETKNKINGLAQT